MAADREPRGGNGRRSRLAAVAANLVVLAVSAAVCLTVLEVLARQLAASRSAARGMDLQHFSADRAAEPDPVLGYRLRKNFEVAGFRYNSLGFAGPEFAADKPPSTLRIICLGGSTTLGAGAEGDRFSYPAILHALFATTTRRPDRNIEVINGGVFGYHGWHSRLRVATELDRYRPDWYLIMDGLNDVMAACQQMRLDDLRGLGDSMDGVLLALAADAGPDRGWLGNLLKRSAALGLLARLARAAGKSPPSPEADFAERLALFGYRDNLAWIAQTALERGQGATIVNYPWIGSEDPAVRREMRFPADQEPLFAFGRRSLAAINAEAAAASGAGLVDPQAVFDRAAAEAKSPRRVYSDLVHFTRYGNYLLAREIYRFLLGQPLFRDATGLDGPPGDAELDALFPELTLWRPVDGTGWPESSEQAVRATVTDTVGLATSDRDGAGWRRVTPAGSQGSIRARIDGEDGLEALFLYPRVGGEKGASVVVEGMCPDGTGSRLYELKNATGDGIWTPVAGRGAFGVPACRPLSLRIVLSGENSQLWVRDGEMLFRPSAAP